VLVNPFRLEAPSGGGHLLHARPTRLLGENVGVGGIARRSIIVSPREITIIDGWPGSSATELTRINVANEQQLVEVFAPSQPRYSDGYGR
jgi:hypothetical protein